MHYHHALSFCSNHLISFPSLFFKKEGLKSYSIAVTTQKIIIKKTGSLNLEFPITPEITDIYPTKRKINNFTCRLVFGLNKK